MKTMMTRFAMVLLGLSLTPLAHAVGFCFDTALMKPFIGIDLQGRDFGFDSNYGGNLFKKELVQYDAYAGVRFFKYLGLMVGFEETENKGRHVFLVPGDVYLGIPVTAVHGAETHETQTRIKGVHLDLMAFLPLNCLPMCPNYDVDFFVTGGIVRNTLQLSDHLVALDGVQLNPDIDNIRTYRNNKTSARFSLGLQKVFCDHVGLRAMIAWENTDRLKDLKPTENPVADSFLNVKDSFIYGIGIFLVA